MASFFAFWVSKNVVRLKERLYIGFLLKQWAEVSLHPINQDAVTNLLTHTYYCKTSTILRFKQTNATSNKFFSSKIHPNPEKSFGPNLGHPNVGEEEAELTPGYLSIVNLSFGVSSL